MDINGTCWQERYHASEIYSLRCKVFDQPGMLGKLITAIGQAQAHVGTIKTVGIESRSRIRGPTALSVNPSNSNRSFAV